VEWGIKEEVLEEITWDTDKVAPIEHEATDKEDNDINPLVLHNISKKSTSNSTISFQSEVTEFGTDNCATHHICSLLNLFTNMRPALSLGVIGVAGSLMASGIGTIEFMLTDNKGFKQKIQLKNVIYLPELAKNLISTTQWAQDRKDNCGILSRSTYSAFMWNNDANQKHIPHPPHLPIPLMPVNEEDEVFILFNTTQSAQYPDNGILLPEGAPQPQDECTISRTKGDTKLDQQSNNVLSAGNFTKESTVWHATQKKRQISIITEQHKINNKQTYTIHPLNSNVHQVVDTADVSEIVPAPADIPTTTQDFDNQLMTECLTKEDLEQL